VTEFDLSAQIAAERRRQDELWGHQDHAPERWLAILATELGELGEAVLQAKGEGKQEWWPSYRSGLVQLAAVAVAAAESFDRREAAGTLQDARFDP
jgi:hypothetical protein